MTVLIAFISTKSDFSKLVPRMRIFTWWFNIDNLLLLAMVCKAYVFCSKGASTEAIFPVETCFVLN